MSLNNISSPAMHETIWFDKPRYDDAERRFYEQQARNAGRGDVRSAGKGTNSAQVIKEGSSVQVKKEVSSMQVKKEASNVHGKKGASGTQAKKGASGAQAKKEVSSVQAKKEANIVQAKKEASNVQDKKDASNMQDKKDASNMQDKKDASNMQDKKDASDMQDKKDASNMQSTEEATSAPSKVFEAEVSTVSLANEIASVRDRITNTIKAAENVQFEHADSFGSLNEKVEQLFNGHAEIAAKVERLFQFFKAVHNMESKIESLNSYLQNLEEKLVNGGILESEAKSQNHVEDDDDIDLFGSDEDDEETSKLRETRLKAYEDKKSKKVPVLAKSFVVFDVKPWTDETDLKEMERLVREVKTDGLVWGQSKLVPVAYGINSLKIGAVVEDDKVSIDWLQETLQDIENHVQSVDIVAFNKV